MHARPKCGGQMTVCCSWFYLPPCGSGDWSQVKLGGKHLSLLSRRAGLCKVYMLSVLLLLVAMTYIWKTKRHFPILQFVNFHHSSKWTFLERDHMYKNPRHFAETQKNFGLRKLLLKMAKKPSFSALNISLDETDTCHRHYLLLSFPHLQWLKTTSIKPSRLLTAWYASPSATWMTSQPEGF